MLLAQWYKQQLHLQPHEHAGTKLHQVHAKVQCGQCKGNMSKSNALKVCLPYIVPVDVTPLLQHGGLKDNPGRGICLQNIQQKVGQVQRAKEVRCQCDLQRHAANYKMLSLYHLQGGTLMQGVKLNLALRAAVLGWKYLKTIRGDLVRRQGCASVIDQCMQVSSLLLELVSKLLHSSAEQQRGPKSIQLHVSAAEH